jgi:ELWxxDGT repeat protein
MNSYPGYDYDMVAYNGKLYFAAMGDTLTGFQLWSSDGTSAGTSQVKQLSSYVPYNAVPFNMSVYNNRLIFTANIDTLNKYVLWSSDGSSAGTHTISPSIAPNNNPLGYYTYMAQANGQLFLNANFNSIGDELWVYSTPTAITETEGDHSIAAYPNPFTAGITLSGLMSNENYSIQVVDIAGRECYSTEIEHSSQSMTLDMPELNTGVYVMTLKGANSSHSFKIVKK